MEHGVFGMKSGPGAAFGLFEPVLYSRCLVLKKGVKRALRSAG